MPIIIIVPIISKTSNINGIYSSITKNPYYLSIFISIIMISSLFVNFYSSEKFKGAFIYRIIPMEEPTHLFRATIKCYLIKFIIVNN